MKEKKEHQLTVGYRWCTNINGKDVVRPVLVIGGKWLEECGFKVGSRVVVKNINGGLVVKVTV